MHCVRDIGYAGDMHCGALGIDIISHRPPGDISLLRKQKYHIAEQYITRKKIVRKLHVRSTLHFRRSILPGL